MLEHFFKSLVATVSDPYQCNRITDALAAAGIKFYCKSKDVNRHNTFDQARIGTLGIKPRYVTEVFVDKENADMALHITSGQGIWNKTHKYDKNINNVRHFCATTN